MFRNIAIGLLSASIVTLGLVAVPTAQAGPLGPTVCANNAPNAPADCVVELKGYGNWGVCVHDADDTCAYVDPDGDLCLYRNADLLCTPLL